MSRGGAMMGWSTGLFSAASKKRKLRQKALEKRLRTLSPEDRQKVRAYLSINSGDEAFIPNLLGSMAPARNKI
jgi:hypothetical protein